MLVPLLNGHPVHVKLNGGILQSALPNPIWFITEIQAMLAKSVNQCRCRPIPTKIHMSRRASQIRESLKKNLLTQERGNP